MSTAPAPRRPSRTRPHGRRQGVPVDSKVRHNCTGPVIASCSPSKSRAQTRREPTKCGRCYDRTQQYSITALTDGAGQVVERYAYSAYGEPTILDASLNVLPDSAAGNRYLYTGREWDGELGLDHYRARMYSAESGRFVSRDPIGYEDGNNLYMSHMGLNRSDPSGTFCWWSSKAIPCDATGIGLCKDLCAADDETYVSCSCEQWTFRCCGRTIYRDKMAVPTCKKKPTKCKNGTWKVGRCGFNGAVIEGCEWTPFATGSTRREAQQNSEAQMPKKCFANGNPYHHCSAFQCVNKKWERRM